MSAASALARGRTLAQSLMVDTCLIQRKTGQTTDDYTGVVTPVVALIYSGPCKVQTSGSGAMGDRTNVGEVSTDTLRFELHLPVVGSELVARGDQVTVTAATNDAALTTKTFRVRDLMHKTFDTARRLLIEEAA